MPIDVWLPCWGVVEAQERVFSEAAAMMLSFG